MTSPPLTHHEILELSEPFVRRGWRVDLAATDRMARRLVFQRRDAAATPGAGPAPAHDEPVIALQLEDDAEGGFLLTRTATTDGGLQARLQARGAHPSGLLDRIEAVAPARQFLPGDGYLIALDQRIDPSPSSGAVSAAAAPAVLLTRAHLAFDALALTMTMPRVKGFPAEIEIRPAAGRAAELPDDLLAVLGWDWTRLVHSGDTWRCSLHLRGRGAVLSQRGMAQLQRLAEHLARTLAEPPARFHERQARARWVVAARSALPLLTLALLIAAAVAVPYLQIEKDSVLRMLIFNSPPLLLALGVSLREIPRFELPRWPRPSRAPAWAVAPPTTPIG